MKTLDWSRLDAAGRAGGACAPARRSDPRLQSAVRAIVEEVRQGGWDALGELALRLDGEPPRPCPSRRSRPKRGAILAPEQLAAIELAAANIRAFHEGSLPAERRVETMPGLIVRKVWRPIDRVGLYVPGGSDAACSRRC